MSYGVIYRLTFVDLLEQTCQLDLEQRDIGDDIVDLTCGHSPIEITFDTSSDNIFAPINGSRALMRLVATTDFQFKTLFTADVRKYRASLYVASVLSWRGFLQPHQGRIIYRVAPTQNVSIAMDQLGYLKTLKWDRENVETELVTLGAILDKTSLDFDLYEAINVYEDNHAQTAADSPLDQTYLSAKRFADKTYYDALHQILFKYKAVIKQDRGHWVITRPEDVGAEYTRRLFTFSSGVFTYDSTATYDPIVNSTGAPPAIAAEDMVRLSNISPHLDITPAWNKYQLTQDLDRVENIFENGDFSKWVDSNPTDWERWREGSMIWSKVSNGVQVQSGAGSNAAFRQRVYLDNITYRFKFQWDVFVKQGVTMKMWIEINRQQPGQPTALHWDFETNAWAYSNSRFLRVYDNDDGEGALWQSDSLEFTTTHSFFKDTEFIEITLYKPVEYLSGGEDNHVVWKYAGAVCGLNGPLSTDFTDFAEDIVEDIEINPNNTKDGGDLEMMLGDVASLYAIYLWKPSSVIFSGHVYEGGLWLDATQLDATQNWTDSSGSGMLVELLKAGLSWAYLNPAEILKVTIFSKLLFSTSVIQELNYENSLYMIKRATWDVKYCSWRVEAYKIGTGPGLALLAENEFELQAEDGQILRGERSR